MLPNIKGRIKKFPINKTYRKIAKIGCQSSTGNPHIENADKNQIPPTLEPSENPSVFFVVCEKHLEQAGCISILPKGIYLFGYCSEEQRMETMQNIAAYAKAEYNTEIPFVIQTVIFTGMFQWVYEIQVW